MIGILDLDMCNIRSVSKAVYSLGQDFVIVKEPDGLAGLSHLIIPGVGSYSEAMSRFSAQGLVEPVRQFVRDGRPLLGICLGMQLLSDSGLEGAGAGDAAATPGLGFVPGHVARLVGGTGHPVPHVGWNNVTFKFAHPVLNGVKSGVDFYFVHSFHFQTGTPEVTLGETEYGPVFTSAVARGNVIGFQFHPEKSQANGLKLLENFCDWNGKC